ncbi:MAG: 2,3-bisphosphoglycerate-dependent phosphoglycerate mutase [Candidatus Paceibacterota bacterium]
METQAMGKLVLVRHHESEWNKLGKWTGVVDVHLSPQGFEGSKKMGELIKDFYFDQIFTSAQIRSQETLASMLTTMPLAVNIPIESSKAINERDYGDYTGKNKWDMEKILGEEEFLRIRRSWDAPIPNGESLKMVYARSVPFFLEKILPILREGKNVLVVAHGNSIRATMKYIENISDEGIAKVEMIFGSVLIYDLDTEGHMMNKEIRQA